MTITSPAFASATPEQQRNMHLEAIFMPEARRRREAFLNSHDPRFVHYTSADAAISILEKKRLWLRNTTAMTDNREVLHGFEMVREFLNTPDLVNRFRSAVDNVHDGVAVQAINRFLEHWNNSDFSPFTQTYIGSVSEHDSEEDKHGRLSMWRAFGSVSVARVALVFRVPLLSGSVQFLNCTFSPVSYLTREGAKNIFAAIIANIVNEQAFLKTVPPDQLLAWLFYMFVLASVCIKHAGFREEREWRLIYSPPLVPAARQRLVSERESVGGIPQLVYKFPIDAAFAPEVAEIDVAAMIDRIIVGPSWHPWVTYQSFTALLGEMGVPNFQERVVTSDIPVRVL